MSHNHESLLLLIAFAKRTENAMIVQFTAQWIHNDVEYFKMKDWISSDIQLMLAKQTAGSIHLLFVTLPNYSTCSTILLWLSKYFVLPNKTFALKTRLTVLIGKRKL